MKHQINVDWLPRVMLIGIAILFIVGILLISFAAYEASQIKPEDIGAVAGRIAKGFNDAKGQP